MAIARIVSPARIAGRASKLALHAGVPVSTAVVWGSAAAVARGLVVDLKRPLLPDGALMQRNANAVECASLRLLTPRRESRMQRKEIVEKKEQYVYPAVANYFAEPLPLERGEMQHVWDVDGKKYLDFFGGIVTVGVGHANARITAAQKSQMDKLGHTSTLYPHQTMVEVAEKIAQI